MNKSVFPAALLLIGIGLSGCPVYDGDSGCYDDYDCDYGYLCDNTGVCYAEGGSVPDRGAVTCRKPSDCGANETCSRYGTCTSGDCLYASVGCVKGYECALEGGRYACLEPVTETDAGGAGGAGGAGSEASAGAGGQGDPPAAAGADGG